MKVVRRLIVIVLIVALAAFGVRLLMPSIAKHLLRSDPLQRADVIVVLGSSRIERTLEAGTLYREGWAPRILLLRPPDALRDDTRERLGVHFPVFLDTQTDVLNQMHVPPSAVALSPGTQDSTSEEADAVARYARQHGYRRVIVVTSPYHTGRAGTLFDRAAGGSFQIVIHPDRYEPTHPDRWWTAYPDRTDVVFEYLKRIYALFFRR